METDESSNTEESKLGLTVEDKIESQESTPHRQNRIMTPLVPATLFEEFDSTRKKLGRSISEVQREMMRNWLDRRAEEKVPGAESAEWKDRLLSRIRALSGAIHAREIYLRMYREQGGDTEKFSDAETILEEMRPRVDKFRRGEGEQEDECELCLDEAHYSRNHLESDWLRFEKYARYRMQYHRLRSGPRTP